jgi:hypothetical protein
LLDAVRLRLNPKLTAIAADEAIISDSSNAAAHRRKTLDVECAISFFAFSIPV